MTTPPPSPPVRASLMQTSPRTRPLWVRSRACAPACPDKRPWLLPCSTREQQHSKGSAPTMQGCRPRPGMRRCGRAALRPSGGIISDQRRKQTTCIYASALKHAMAALHHITPHSRYPDAPFPSRISNWSAGARRLPPAPLSPRCYPVVATTRGARCGGPVEIRFRRARPCSCAQCTCRRRRPPCQSRPCRCSSRQWCRTRPRRLCTPPWPLRSPAPAPGA